jgi:hypothetical protein
VLRRSAATAVVEARASGHFGLAHQRLDLVADLHHQHYHWSVGIRVLGLHRLGNCRCISKSAHACKRGLALAPSTHLAHATRLEPYRRQEFVQFGE